MYKSKLQELCHKRSWTSPEYLTSKEGPDHDPRYTATITVNGIEFETPSACRTAKAAQNNVAKLALDHFSLPKRSPPNSPSSFSPLPPPSKSIPFPQTSLPQHSFPQPQVSFPQPSLPQLSLPQPSLSQLSFPQPSLINLSFPQPSLPQTSSPTSSGSSGPAANVDNIRPARRVLQPDLQQACETSQISSPVTAVKDTVKAGDQKNNLNMQHLYKNQLQNYAQKKNLDLPVYSSEREGPPHASRFKCKVTIDGQTYESLQFFPTLKDAEHAAAKVALMSLSISGAQEDDTALYKNLLQELAQKEGFHLPVYSTKKSGESHVPIFVSNVEIEGEIFTGQEAKTKKQAEISAAKAAYTTLKERKGKSDQSSLFPFSASLGQAPQFSSSSSESNVTTALQHANPKSAIRCSPGLVTENLLEKDKGFAEVEIHHTDKPTSESVTVTGNKGLSSEITNGCEEDASLSDDQSSFASDMPSTAVSASARRKVIVYSRQTNVKVAEGGTLLPISDNNWAAYSYLK